MEKQLHQVRQTIVNRLKENSLLIAIGLQWLEGSIRTLRSMWGGTTYLAWCGNEPPNHAIGTPFLPLSLFGVWKAPRVEAQHIEPVLLGLASQRGAGTQTSVERKLPL